jgi:hypothetical protein
VIPPDTQAVHAGYGVPTEERRQLIVAWLEANGIDPQQVVSTRPVFVLAVPNGTVKGGVPWLIDVIVFHQYYEHPDGHREVNLITREAVAFQRTVPLQVPFPADPETAGEGTSQEEGEA